MMRKLAVLSLALIAVFSLGAMAETGLTDDAQQYGNGQEVVSESVDLAVPEEDSVSLGGAREDMGYADFVGDAAVSAASGDVAIDEANFPDEVFRSYVRNKLDSNGDGALSDSERNAVTAINVDGEGEDDIRSLKGIEWFPNLNRLICNSQTMESLDVSGNTALTELFCSDCKLTSLNASGCASLKYLTCTRAEITHLNLSGCAALKSLSIREGLVTLDISGCKALTELDLGYIPLTGLNASGCTALTEFEYYRNDGHISDKTLSLDFSGCTSLTYLGVWGDRIASLNVKGCSALKKLACSDNLLTELDVSGCTALTELHCDYNALKRLDVSKCTALTELECYKNQLSDLDVSKNKKLKKLNFWNNQVKRIDLSANTLLEELDCSSNKLTKLDTGRNTALVDLQCAANQLTELDVGKNKALRSLYCNDNWLTGLNVSRNTELNSLNCSGNRLTGIDVSKNTNLYSLYCGGKKLTRLDLSKNTKLERLECHNTGLTGLDLSKNPKLYYLWLAGTAIPSVDISACPDLCKIAKTKPMPYDLPDVIDAIRFEGNIDWRDEMIVISPSTSLIANGKVLYGNLPANHISLAKITVKNQAYTGKTLKPKVTVTRKGKTLKKGTDYTLTWKNNKAVGTATVTVKGKGKYTGKEKVTFKINPRAVKGLALKADRKALTLTWKKVSEAAGYEIQYVSYKGYSVFGYQFMDKINIKNNRTVNKKIKDLKAKEKYIVRIRSYKTVKGVKYYSPWVEKKMTTK